MISWWRGTKKINFPFLFLRSFLGKKKREREIEREKDVRAV
jgi:hypothetical protein